MLVDNAEIAPDWLRTLSPGVDRELVGDFVQECCDHCQHIEAALLSLDADPEDVVALHAAFRAFHTMKGTAAFLGFASIAELAHHTESLLSRMREGELRCTGSSAELLFRSADLLKGYTQALQDALQGMPLLPPPGLEALLEALRQAAGTDTAGYTVELAAPPRLGDILVAEGKVARQDVENVAADRGGLPIGIALVRAGTASLPDVAQALRTQRLMLHAVGSSGTTVRVRLEHLDNLFDVISELVIAQSLVAQDTAVGRGSHENLRHKMAQVDQLVRRLHALSFALRMVPLKATIQRMRRVARDVAQRAGKLVAFSAVGEETEIDRNLVELLTYPLQHMVRNAIDHGIEPPEVREQAGKARLGQVWLEAYNTSQHVVITLHDDGQGLACDKIVAKALQMGLITSAQGLTEQEIYRLILRPGFSTADVVTDISGRGVGMDVVCQSIEAMHGHLEITSQVGQGTTFIVLLPLRLALTDGTVVQVGPERYIIPSDNVLQSFPRDFATVRQDVGQGDMVTWKGESLPLVPLHRLFTVSEARQESSHGFLVIVASDGAPRYALLVDALLGTQQVIAKPWGAGMGQRPGIAGAAILTDGSVGLLLDLAGVLALARQTVTGPWDTPVREDGETAVIRIAGD